MEYLSKERHDRIVAELKQLIDEAMYSHSLLLAAVAAALLLPACSSRNAARIDDGASARVEVLRSELKEWLATQDEDAIDSLAASLYRYGEHTQDHAVRLYGMVTKAQSFYLRAGQTDSVSKYLSQGEALARQEQDWWALATLCNIKGARQAGLHRWYIVHFSDDTDLDEAALRLSALGKVKVGILAADDALNRQSLLFLPYF